MKKLLLSFTALALAFSSMAQSDNSVGSDYAVYNFNGTSDDNCGTIETGVKDAWAPDSRYNQPSYTDYSYNGTQLVVNKKDPSTNPADNGWHKMPFQFATGCLLDDAVTLNLSAANASYFKIKVNVSAAVPQMVVYFREGAKYNDKAPWMASLTAGDNEITITTPIDWNQNATGAPALDPTKIDGFAIAFRTSWDNNSPLEATIKIDQIVIGNKILSTNLATLPSEVNYYPNPSSTNITVDNIAVSSLKLMDVNGTVVREASASNVSVEGLASGLYFLQINGFKPVKVMVK